MILDTVSRLSRYAALDPLFLRVAEYLRRSDLNLWPTAATKFPARMLS